jgi:hypothetical protein
MDPATELAQAEKTIDALQGLIALILLSTAGNGVAVTIPERWLTHTDKLELFEERTFDGGYNIAVRVRQQKASAISA